MMRLLSLCLLALLCACPERDYCAESPLCEEGRAINCDALCTAHPCTNSPRVSTCGESARCTVVPGPPDSPRFYKSRALCVVESSDTCEPQAAPPPTCDALGRVQGCSAYRRTVVAPCSQAELFFESAPCCRSAPDGGGPAADAGAEAPDAGGSADGGA
jgi:hypothetical protein